MATPEALSTGNGATTTYAYAFDTLDQAHVKASLNGVDTTAFTIPVAGQVQFNTAPTNGAAIRIYRLTPDTSINATFTPGSALRSQDLNSNFEQLLFVTQEDRVTADNADTKADLAIATANAAVVTADAAETKADAAVATANAADAKSDTAVADSAAAVIVAGSAEATAISAAADADAAVIDATTALSTANATAAQFAALEANVYDATELDAGQLDNRYYTETEADARFWNVNSGEYQASTDTWAPTDTHLATTAAIEARIVALVDQVGGFVPVATHLTFPTTNPDVNDDAGTVVSIQSVSGLTHSAGTSTNATTTGAVPVTITGIPASLPSPAGTVGMLVVTTGTLNTYTFHRLTPEVNDVATVAANATEISTVAGIDTEVTTVAGVAANVTTVAGNTTNINTVAADIANVNTAAANIANINTVAGVSANVTTVAGNTANINSVVANAADISTVAASIADVNTVADNIADVTAVVANETNINTAVANLAAINAAPTEAANAAASAAAALVSEGNASTSASNASTSETNAAASASAAATSAAAALVSEQNADDSEALALQYRDDTAGLLAQAGSDVYNVNTNQSWGDIITGAVSHFANEVLADVLLTMSTGTNTYDYGTII